MLNKILLKIKIQLNFLLIQKWGLLKSGDLTDIPKYKIKKYLGKNPVIIDCGAHVGADSIEWSKLLPKATVHAFEPVPTIFESLKRNTRRYKNILCYPIALSDKNGHASLHVSGGTSDASSSLLSPKNHLLSQPDVTFENVIEVKTNTLQVWAKEKGIDKVDFLWLDMQGFEYNMLKESQDFLANTSVIYTEVSLSDSYDGVVQYGELKGLLISIGFVPTLEELPLNADFGNVLFVRQ